MRHRHLMVSALWLISAIAAAASTTIVDLISTDPGFSRLVKELQHTRLVPLLNGLHSEDCKSCTFFAPTNAAFAKWDAENPSKKDRRNTLLYHILGNSVFSHDLKDAMLLETLLVKHGYLGDNGEGQLVAVSKPSWRPGRRGQLLVGDAELLQKDWKADNGVVHVVDRLLIPPGDIVDTLQKHEELSALYSIIRNAGLDAFLRQHRPFTLFAPTGDALKKLNPIQVRYLLHEQGLKDLEATVQHHIHTGTLYRRDIQPGSSSVTTVEGQELMVNLDDKLMVDNAVVERTDILAANGVIHTVSRPLLPSALVWTAAKYLIGMNATKFVEGLRQAGMNRYIDDPEASYTIFAPQDESSESAGSLGAFGEVDEALQYHIVPGRKLYPSLYDGQLLETELHTAELNGGAQRSKIEIKKDHKRSVLSIDSSEILGEPVLVGKSVIYLVARPLDLPHPIVKRMKLDESLSGFMQALSKTGLSRRLSDARGVTVFAPSTAAWDALGVVKNYLMLDRPATLAALEAVARYAIVENIVYTPDIKSGRTVLSTSEGAELILERNGDDIYVGEGRLERSTQVGGRITGKDILVKSGVIHTVSSVALPPTLSITLFNVLEGAGTKSFLQAFETSNITRILTDWGQDYTIFAPTDEAFQKADLEGALNDRDFVATLVRLHVIPGKVLKLEEDVHEDEPSLLNNEARLSFRDIHHNGKSFGVRVKGARSKKEALVVGVGHAHPAQPTEGSHKNGGDYAKEQHSGPGMKQQQRQDFALEDDEQDVFSFYNTPREMVAPRSSGVVYVIDRVLLPGDPDPLGGAWFWISVILLGLLGTTVLCALTALSVHALIQEVRQLEGYQNVPTTDEEAAVAGSRQGETGDAPQARPEE
ncbi:hypothetical protein BGZ70_000357 [Mortierella alpina]|uniref:FAS1 domain-containing protein n=1 Tax=Mortierella alpina TaxID=64518 RepID=A0A9P6J186_MORAP|nr:hypothetical protein BGZ70_000357 [Mortierella alpina]